MVPSLFFIGKVKGVKFDHEKRDNIRTQISRIMKYDIEPPLSTVHYSISFAPVRTIKGEDQGKTYRTIFVAHMYVLIEIV